MFTQIRIKRTDAFGMTGLELQGPDSEIHVKFLSRLGKRERRAVLRSFLVQIRPWLDHFTKGAIDHSRDGLIRDRRAGRREVSILKGHSVGTLPGAFGMNVRMRRLEIGLTQAELAQVIGIRRSHLSDLERGIYLPGPKTREEIDRVLSNERSFSKG